MGPLICFRIPGFSSGDLYETGISGAEEAIPLGK
jgi:hypothetical protein